METRELTEELGNKIFFLDDLFLLRLLDLLATTQVAICREFQRTIEKQKDFEAHISPAKETKAILFTDKHNDTRPLLLIHFKIQLQQPYVQLGNKADETRGEKVSLNTIDLKQHVDLPSANSNL
ncbi:hypothetical protein MTR67_012909 [Solanum verrucosum]|uniref:Uncharacterized protein n=1 Tax=Solanum verrucosum TaxID=315347 RepID=A0AAF0THX3_SOLVR|nr:hypothetical protein MTR67_012909 [Solanum verrucosum]